MRCGLVVVSSLGVVACGAYPSIGQAPVVSFYSEIALPTAGSGPVGIAAGPDGNLWVTEELGGKIARVTPAGKITEYDVPTPSSNPWNITVGPDRNLWFTESGANKVATQPGK